MRFGPVFVAAFALVAAWSAPHYALAQSDGTQSDGAQSDGAEARDHFEAALSQDCPQKQLQLLSARNLRDGLDSYVESLSGDLHDRVQKAETDHCSTADAGAVCVNLADIQAADDAGHVDDLALSICGSFLRCTDQGACDYAR